MMPYKNKEIQNQYYRDYYSKNRERVLQIKKKYRLKNLERYNAYHRIKSKKKNMLRIIKLGGKCYLCGSTEKLEADHNHQTGVYRSALCRSHNIAIGSLEKLIRENLLDKALDYVGKIEHWQPKDLIQD